MAPEDIIWDLDDQGISNRDGWGPHPGMRRHPGNNGTMAMASRGGGRFSRNEPTKDSAPPQNGINRNIGHIDVPNTRSVVIEVNYLMRSDIMHSDIGFLPHYCMFQPRWRGFCPIQIWVRSKRPRNFCK